MKTFLKLMAGVFLLSCALIGHATNWPSVLNADSNLYIAVNNCGTYLTSSITNVATTLSVNDTTCFPTVGYVTIDEEAILCTGKTANTFTGCTRGSDGTSAVAHTKNKMVAQYMIAAHHNVLKDELIAISNYFMDTGTEIHIDTTNARVGISTGTPQATLDVHGDVMISGTLDVGGVVGDLIMSGPFVDIRAYGATGDGSDEATEIQAAFTAAGTGTLLITTGTWATSAQLTGNCSVKGLGPSSIIQQYAGSTIAGHIVLLQGDNTSISDVVIDGNASGGASATYGLTLNSSRLVASNVRVHNTLGSGVYAGTGDIALDDCMIEGLASATTSQIGILVTNVTSFHMSGGIVKDWGINGIFESGMLAGVGIHLNGVKFFGNHRQYTPTGGGQIVLPSTGYSTVVGCEFGLGDGGGGDSTATSAIECEGPGTITGNFIDGGGIHPWAIAMSHGSGFVVTGNTIQNFATTAVGMGTSVDYSSISGNVFLSNTQNLSISTQTHNQIGPNYGTDMRLIQTQNALTYGLRVFDTNGLDYVNIYNTGSDLGIIQGADESNYRALALNPYGGNVVIGTTTTPLSAFSVDGGVHVGGVSDPGDNNLLVDGTVEVTGATVQTGLLKTVGGVHVGGTSDPGADNLLVDGTAEITGATTLTGLTKTVGGVHVGGTSDPGADNLLVDGTAEITGATTLTGLTKTVAGVHVGGTSDPGADNLIVDGTVAIGTTTASGKLHVNGGDVIVHQAADGFPFHGLVLYGTGLDYINIYATDSGYAGIQSGVPGNYGDLAIQPYGGKATIGGIDFTEMLNVKAGAIAVSTMAIPSASAGYAKFYSTATAGSAEMWVIDAAGNHTQLSPHDPESGNWIFNSYNSYTGDVVKIDMIKVIEALQRLTGEAYIVKNELISTPQSKASLTDAITDEQKRHKERIRKMKRMRYAAPK